MLGQQLTILAEKFNPNPNALGIPNVRATGGVLDSVLGQVFIAVGAIALLFLLVGAFRYVISGGDQSQVKQAKDTMLYAIIGLIIAVAAFAIIQFVSNRVS